MKISVIMVDGCFRENTFGAKFFANQDFDDFEVIWVDFYDKVNPSVESIEKVKPIALNRDGIYHSSYCFNEGIKRAQGEVIVIPDADQIVKPNFLSEVWLNHKRNERLVMYCYRYDELKRGELKDLTFEELEKKCVLKNTTNYGGCLSVRKKWLEYINGYEQNKIFQTGMHANGLDVYTRFKNIGLEIMWHPTLKLFHPWHPFTLSHTTEQKSQERFINWRKQNLQYKAFDGLTPNNNEKIPEKAKALIEHELSRLENEQSSLENKSIKTKGKRLLSRLGKKLYRKYLQE